MVFFSFRFFGCLSSNPHSHEPDILEAIQDCRMMLEGRTEFIFLVYIDNSRCSWSENLV